MGKPAAAPGGLSECARLVRRSDFDRFAVSLFAPGDRRESLFALYAFNHEIAKVRETVREPMLGMIRLQWWRDAVAEIYGTGTVRQHAVAQALADAVRRHGLSRVLLDRMIDAREQDLDNAPPATVAALERYARDSAGTLMVLAGEVLGSRDPATAAGLDALGAAWAITGLVRAIPFHARAARQYIPVAVASAAGLSSEALFAGKGGAALQGAVAAMAAVAASRLDRSRTALAGRGEARALLPFGALAGLYLRRIRRRRYDLSGGAVDVARPVKLARLWWAARTGRF